MRNLSILLLIFLIGVVTYCSPAEKVAVPEIEQPHDFQYYITEEFLKEHMYEFAGDEMMGRGSGTKYIAKAADYIAEFNESVGLTPVGDDGTYFQHFDLNARYLDGFEFTTLTVSNGDTTILSQSQTTYREAADFSRTFGGEQYTFGEIVYAGFGVVDEERGVNHLGDANIEGKWVLVFEDIPHVVGGDTLIDPEYDQRARFNELLYRYNATGILNITQDDEAQFEEYATKLSLQFGGPITLGLTYREPRQRFRSAVLNVSPERAAALLDIDGGYDAVMEKRMNLIESIQEFQAASTGIHLISEPKMRETIIQEKNVAGLLEGSDPDLKDEIIVLMAHYDHMGIGHPTEDGDVIYNGADDNGSGSISLMNIAKALSKAKEEGMHPKRSVLFLHVAVEEWGLLGSRYYSDNPIFPIENTVANINVDMMGRWDAEHEAKGDRDFVYVIGAEIISSDLDRMLHEANSRSSNIRLDMRYNNLSDPNRFYRRSDHWNFGRLQVPFIFFFSGVHDDYHAPGDTPDKILYDSLMKRARVIYSTVVEVGNSPERPVVDNDEFIRITEMEAR